MINYIGIQFKRNKIERKMVREEPKIERKNVIFINNFCIILFY